MEVICSSCREYLQEGKYRNLICDLWIDNIRITNLMLCQICFDKWKKEGA